MSTHAPPRSGQAPVIATVPWRRLASVRLALVLWGGLAVVDAGTLAHAPAYAELGAVCLLVVVASIGIGIPAALGVALVGWLVVDGFVVHSLGVLGFDGAPDAARLALLVALAAAATRVRR